jgi:hypothetical protein
VLEACLWRAAAVLHRLCVGAVCVSYNNVQELGIPVWLPLSDAEQLVSNTRPGGGASVDLMGTLPSMVRAVQGFSGFRV